jgi:tetratricopeptide (TPR) repeat protein
MDGQQNFKIKKILMQADYPRLLQRGLKFLALNFVLLGFLFVPRVEANPPADAHFKSGLQLGLQKKWAQAEAEYRKAIALDPKNATYKSYLADALAAQGKFAQAQNSYKRGAPAGKTVPRLAAKKPVTARRTASKPVRARPSTSSSSSHTTSGSTQGMPAIPLPPAGNDGDGNLKGREEPLIIMREETTTTATTETSEHGWHQPSKAALIHYDKGVMVYSQNQQWPQAEAEYRAALRLDPKFDECWDALGDALFKQSKWQDAEKAYREAARLQPAERDYHIHLAVALLKQSRRTEATTEAKEAMRLGLEDHEVFDELGLTKATH